MHLSTVTSSSSGSNAPPQKKKSKDHQAPSSSLLLLPDEISLNCLARLPRCYHPSVSMVSTSLRRLIASPEIYAERSALHRAEHVLHVALRPHGTETLRWYTLNLLNPFGQQQVRKHRLVHVPSFPLVSVGSEIYFLGGCVNEKFVSTGFVIDCPSYTCRFLPRMKQKRGCAAAGVVDGKLYVVGGCSPLSSNWVEAFDLKTQTWDETVTTGLCNDVEVCEKAIRSFVMDGKIYVMDRKSSFVYDPIKGSLEKDLLLTRRWGVVSCVIDNKLYTFDRENNYTMWEFDPVSWVWRRVMGLEDLPGCMHGVSCSKMAGYGGKIAIFCNLGMCSTKIWYGEIGLERREGGEVWGNILSSGLVLAWEDPSTISRSLSASF